MGLHASKWQIQDFTDGGTETHAGGTNLLFGQILPDNCMKMKEIVPKGACAPSASLDPPMQILSPPPAPLKP